MVGSTNSLLPLELNDIGLRRSEKYLLEHVNHRFYSDSLSIVLGHNGSGKTLLLKVCHGLLKPTDGTLKWSSPALAMRAGVQAMVFQKPVTLRRSIAANIDYALKVCEVSPNKRQTRLQQALEFAGLRELSERSARVLSGGEQQRLALARAWAVEPQVLFLDEPCSQLDPGATQQVERMIKAIHKSGTKVIMTTHDLGQARRLADEVLFMHRGTVLEAGEAEQFFMNTQTEAAQAFLQGHLYW